MGKDPLCPLGFHPQVRWPTRCKRCFRDYKEHTVKKEESTTASTAALLSSSSYSLDKTGGSSYSRSTYGSSSYLSSDDSYSSRSRNYSSSYDTPSSTSSTSTSSGISTESTSSSASSSSASATNDSKDFSTPYSSISSEARTRLSRFRDESTRPVSPNKSDSLSVPSDTPVLQRRRTTDLSDVETETKDSSKESSSSSSASTDTVTVRLRKANSFGGGTDSSTDDSSNSSSPTPPSPKPRIRSRTPSLKDLTKEPSPAPPSPKTKPKFSFSTSLPDDNSSSKTTTPSIKKYGLKKDSPSESPSTTTSTTTPADTTPITTTDSPSKPKKTKRKRLLIQEVKEVTPTQQESYEATSEPEESADVAFIIQVKATGKKKKAGEEDDDLMSMTTATDTTETTLVDVMDGTVGGMSSWEVEDMKKENERLREKCDKLEKEKAEILTRRVASLDAPRPQSSEYLRLQQKVNQLTTANEDLKDEQKHLEARVRELEADLSTRPNPDLFQRQISDLRSKLTASESQIDQLQEEKRDAIQQMKDMQEEFEEMQDSFREEQAEEFANLKKELDDASKNCRLLQFKLRKVEKRADQLEAEKKELEQRLESIQDSGRIRKLEEELKKSKGEIEKLKAGAKDTLGVPGFKKKGPLTKSLSSEKDSSMPPDFDPHKTLRDLQSALERESDLREQLRFAEEESTSLRQKISRIENENDTLLIQIKKMSSKSKTELNKGKTVETGKVGEQRANASNKDTDKMDVDDLKLQLEINEQESKVLQKKVEELEKANSKLSKDLQKAEDKAQSLEKAAPNITKSKNVDEVTALRRKLIEKERDVERLQAELASAPKSAKGKSPTVIRQKSLEDKIELETKAELKKVQQELAKLKAEAEAEKTSMENELYRARQDLENHQSRIAQMGEANKNLLTEMSALKSSLGSMKEQYENIQDDMVLKNSKLTGQKEQLEDAMNKLRQEHNTIDKELRALRETFNNRQDTWIKEKLALQEKLRETEQNSKKLMTIPGDRESTKLKNLLNESTRDLESKAKELEQYKDQLLHMERENSELRRKLEDFDKVAQVQNRTRALPEPSYKTDKELKELKEKLAAEEKLHRNEMAQIKMRHDKDLAVKVEEISAVQQQLSRAKRERDTFRQMVDSAQRAIAELKSRGPSTRSGSISGLEEAATGAQAALSGLQERVTALEDDLSEARRETSRQKTEFVTEKSAWEMKTAELQQKINELEEERLLSGAGRVRGSSALGRTKLELAWQKEREEQQRRLKEATTLARDLKTTLLEIEREKDRERMEAKRRFEQLKLSLEEEQQEMKRKVESAQSDLLELRDAHAKLRTANEKLRKDRERLENQREAQIKRELDLKKVRAEKDKMLDQIISKLGALNPTASNSNLSQMPPKLGAAEILHHLQNIKGIEDPEDLLNPKEKKRGHFKRAASVGDTEGAELPKSRESLVSMPASYGVKGYSSGKQYLGTSSASTLTLPSRGGPGRVSSSSSASGSSSTKKFSSNMSDGGGVSSYSPQGKLMRKALSLDQNVSMPDEQKIWKGGSEAGSGQSLTSADGGSYSRGSSVERMSTLDSKAKSNTLVGKMKKFVKAKSIEETPAAEKLMLAGSQGGSDLSLNSEFDGKEKRGIKDKVKGMFKRSTRSPSVERRAPGTTAPSSLQLQQPQPQHPPEKPARSRESTPKREMTPSQQRPLMPSQQRPLMSSANMSVYR